MKKIDISNLKNFSRKGRDRVRNTAIAAGIGGVALAHHAAGASDRKTNKEFDELLDSIKNKKVRSDFEERFSPEAISQDFKEAGIIVSPNSIKQDLYNRLEGAIVNGKVNKNKVDDIIDDYKNQLKTNGVVSTTTPTNIKDFVTMPFISKNAISDVKFNKYKEDEEDNNDDSAENFSDKKKLAKKVAIGLAGVGALGLANGEFQTHRAYHNLMDNIKDPYLKRAMPSPTDISIGALQEGIPYVSNSAKQKLYNTVDESLVNGGKGFIGKPLTYGKLAWNFHKWGRDAKDAMISGDINDAVEPTNLIDKYIVHPAYNIAGKISNSFNFSKELPKVGSTDKKELAKKVVSGFGAGLGVATGLGGMASLAYSGNNIYKDYKLNKQLTDEKEKLLSEVTPLRDIGRSPKLYNEFAERLANATTEEEKQKIYEEINNLPEEAKDLILEKSIGMDESLAYTHPSSYGIEPSNFSKKNSRKFIASKQNKQSNDKIEIGSYWNREIPESEKIDIGSHADDKIEKIDIGSHADDKIEKIDIGSHADDKIEKIDIPFISKKSKKSRIMFSDSINNNFSKKSTKAKILAASLGLGTAAATIPTTRYLNSKFPSKLEENSSLNAVNTNLKNEKEYYNEILKDRDAYNKALAERYDYERRMAGDEEYAPLTSSKGYVSDINTIPAYQDSVDKAKYGQIEKAVSNSPELNKAIDNYITSTNETNKAVSKAADDYFKKQEEAERVALEKEINDISDNPSFDRALESVSFSDPVVAYFYSEKKSSKEDKELKELQEAKAISDAKQMENIKENIENPKVLPNGKFTDDVIKKSNWKDTYKFGTALGAGMATGSAIVGGAAAAGIGLLTGLGAAALSFSENGEPVAEYYYSDNKNKLATAATIAGAGLGGLGLLGLNLYNRDNYGDNTVLGEDVYVNADDSEAEYRDLNELYEKEYKNNTVYDTNSSTRENADSEVNKSDVSNENEDKNVVVKEPIRKEPIRKGVVVKEPVRRNFSDFHSSRRKAVAGTVAGLGATALIGKKLYDKFGRELPENGLINNMSKEEQVEDVMHENDMMMATSMEFSDKFTKLFSEKNKSPLFEKLANGGLGGYIRDTMKNGKATIKDFGLKNNTYNKEKKK